jgi:hypothetical protein
MSAAREGIRKSPSKKRVNFHSEVAVREVYKRGNPSDQWYSKLDLKTIGIANFYSSTAASVHRRRLLK